MWRWAISNSRTPLPGRVPTPLGYRMYVNELMEKQKLSLEETEEMNRRMNQKMQQLDDTISDVSKLVSQLTDLPALALTSQTAVTIRRFDLIYVDANTFIIVVMLSSNSVKNRLVHLPISVDQSMVQKLATLFNASFTGITADQITPLLISSTERAADDTMGLASVIAAFAIEVLTEANTPSAYISGENRLLSQPEFRDPDKAHRLMSYLSGGGIHPPPQREHGRNRRGASPHRAGKCGRRAERFKRGHRKLRRGRQHARAYRRRRADKDGLFRSGREAQLPRRGSVQAAWRRRSPAGGDA